MAEESQKKSEEDTDTFEDLEYLGRDTLAIMSDKDKRDMRLTKKISKTLDWIAIIGIGISTLGFGIYSLAPEQTTQLYNYVAESINSLYQPASDSYTETLDS